MTLTFDRNTLGNRALAPVLTAFVLKGCWGLSLKTAKLQSQQTPLKLNTARQSASLRKHSRSWRPLLRRTSTLTRRPS